MSFGGGPTGFHAIKALVESQADFRAVADKDWGAAAGLIVRKLLNAAGQTAESLIALRAAVGEDIFETQLKSLTHHQSRLLARRLDKSVPDLEVSTASAAVAHVRTLLIPQREEIAADPPTEEMESEPETAETEAGSEQSEGEAAAETNPDSPSAEPSSDETNPDDPPPANAYFGRKSFRTG